MTDRMTTIDLKVPTSYNQLSRKQLLQVSRHFLANLPRNTLLTRAFCRFAGLKPVGSSADGTLLFRYKKQVIPFDLDTFNGMVATQKYLLDMSLTQNRWLVLWVGLRRYFGPSSRCYNLTLREYLHAEHALFSFASDKSFRHIDRLCSILYRPGGKGSQKGDPRRSFNEHESQRRIKYFRMVSRAKRFAVFLFYSGCRGEFSKAFPHLFSGSVVSSELKNPAQDILQMVRVLNQDDITRNETILSSSLWEAFAQLNDLAARAAKNKQHAAV